LSEKINHEVLKRGFEKTKDCDWYVLTARGDQKSRAVTDPPELVITANLKNGKNGRAGTEIGELQLRQAQGEYNRGSKEENLYAPSVYVDEEYQRKGIASAMYKFAKELGNTILPSLSQTDDAKAFWSSQK
jgi:GNAT superfamily N-acetyltransferase